MRFLKTITSNLLLNNKQVVVTHQFQFSVLVKSGTHPGVLPLPRLTLTLDFTSIIHSFQDLRYIGELRQRWEEIKKLKASHSLAI